MLAGSAYAMVPGVSPRSSDGVRGIANVDSGITLQAYGNTSPQSVAPYTTARRRRAS